ncbi:hypothetical protein CerSpe_081500 [Prunus speciosa]
MEQNFFAGFHGGAVAAVAEAVSIACARTVVAKDKEIFLGELSISYLASAKKNAEVIVDASVVRSGRNLSVIVLESTPNSYLYSSCHLLSHACCEIIDLDLKLVSLLYKAFLFQSIGITY